MMLPQPSPCSIIVILLNRHLVPVVDVVKVTQNWSLECKIDVCWKCKIGARIGKIEARFWLYLGAFCFDKNRRPNGGIRVPMWRNSFFRKSIFEPDLLQFYEGYFYYKYRLCIRVNLEIEGAETRV